MLPIANRPTADGGKRNAIKATMSNCRRTTRPDKPESLPQVTIVRDNSWIELRAGLSARYNHANTFSRKTVNRKRKIKQQSAPLTF
jgi:hypothetical protein